MSPQSSIRIMALAASILCSAIANGQIVEKKNADGTIIELYNLVDGNIQGLYQSFYASGRPLIVCWCIDGLPVGEWISYYDVEGAIPQQQGRAYSGGYNGPREPLKTGLWRSYHKNGKLASTGVYRKNIAVGQWLTYYDNGNRSFVATFDFNGVMKGQWRSYYPSGKLRQTGIARGHGYNWIQQPWPVGSWTAYWENGKIQSQFQYDDESKHRGTNRTYYDNGQKQFVVETKNGILDGEYKFYYDNGQLYLTGVAKGSGYKFLEHPIKEGLWLTYDRNGNIVDAGIYKAGLLIRKVEISIDDESGQATLSYEDDEGVVQTTQADQNGIVDPEVQPAEPVEPVSLLMEDTETGRIVTERVNPDGSVSRYEGFHTTESDGTERYVETDRDGNRVETEITPEGEITVTRSSPGQGTTTTTTDSEGNISTVSRDVYGNETTTSLDEYGNIVSVKRDPKGIIESVTYDRPDGFRVTHTDEGARYMKVDEEGFKTEVHLDQSGNSTTTVTDPNGEVLLKETDYIGPREPGREYYEQVLGGDEWSKLPESTKARYATSERRRERFELRNAERRRDEAGQEAERARNALQAAEDSEAARIRMDELQSEYEALDRQVERRKDREARASEIEAAYRKAKDLQTQYDAALMSGDREEAARIMKLQDEHHEASQSLLLHTSEEKLKLEAKTQSRADIASSVSAQAYGLAGSELTDIDSYYETKGAVTDVAGVALIGATMQSETNTTSWHAERQKALALARIEVIDKWLTESNVNTEERAILEDLKFTANSSLEGAQVLLDQNGNITSAGYVIDAALTLTGAKAATAITRATARTASTTTARALNRSAVRTAMSGADEAGGSLTRTVNLTDDSANSLSNTARRSGEDTIDWILRRVDNSMTPPEHSLIVGRDVLPLTPPVSLPIQTNPATLARYFKPGVKLSGKEIQLKAEILAQRAAARQELQRAFFKGAPEEVFTQLQQKYQYLNDLIEDAIAQSRPPK
jgi:antitoxin component YwqK of YwqJK toxin-antitoxin module